MKVRISVIVPVYNTVQYIDKCIRSIMNQKFKDFELIIVDDGSTDGSGELLDSICKGHDNIKVFRQENSGQSIARNFALKKAIGEYIIFVDSDDWIEPDTLDILYNLAEETNSDFVNCRIRFINQKTGKGKVYGRKYKYRELLGEDIFCDALIEKSINSQPCNKLYRRDFLERYSIFFPEGIFNEDIVFVKKVAYFAAKTVFINKVLYNSLIREASTTRKMSIKNLEMGFAVLSLLRDFMKKEKVFTKNDKFYMYYYIKLLNFLFFRAIFRSDNLLEWENRIYKSFYFEYYKKIKYLLPVMHRLFSLLIRYRIYKLLSFFRFKPY